MIATVQILGRTVTTLAISGRYRRRSDKNHAHQVTIHRGLLSSVSHLRWLRDQLSISSNRAEHGEIIFSFAHSGIRDPNHGYVGEKILKIRAIFRETAIVDKAIITEVLMSK